MPTPSTLCHLILDVQDLDRSLEFYHGMLCLPISKQERMEGHRLAYLTTGKTEILLIQQPKNQQPVVVDRSGTLMLKFQVRNLPEVVSALEKAPIKVLQKLDNATMGERTFLVADPDGYVVLLSEPVETLH
jgi:lactoylglutathione lyase